VPDLEQETAAHERRAERDSAQHVLDPLRATVRRRRQQVRVQAAVRRLVDVIGEEEGEDDQRRRPEGRHEGHQQQAEPHRAKCGQHERSAAAHRRVERVAPGADDGREQKGEDALGAQDEADQATRGGELMQERRQVRGRRRDRKGKAEGAESQDPDEAAPEVRRARRWDGSYLRH
jgi:hypothetical protein